MLEKLGWIQGQGLGVDGNKGINEPILAKVKTSKLVLNREVYSTIRYYYIGREQILIL